MNSGLFEKIESLAGASPLLLEHLASPDIGAMRDSGDGMLLLPIGATEQHGPHLPVAMDTLLVEAVCWFASAKTNIPVLPALRYTVSQGHTPKWPGTFSLTHETFIQTACEIVEWAVNSGWRKILMVNSHFGNDASARVALDKIRLKHIVDLQVGLRNVYDLTPEIWDAYTGDAGDLHANKAETDLMLYLTPHLVHSDRLQEADDPDRTGGTVFSYPVPQTSLNGVTGFPSKANPEDGGILFEKMTTQLTHLIETARSEKPPLVGASLESI